MDSKDLKRKIDNLSIWKKDGQRAPHKPLLLLYALAQITNGRTRFMPYTEIREKLGYLLKEFGPVRKSYHPEQPFVRLKNDGIWELNNSSITNDFSNKLLLDEQVSGGFTKDIFSMLNKDRNLLQEIAQNLLNAHFPDTFHEDILIAVGLDFDSIIKKKRDAAFRERVLKAYGYSCAVCDFNVRLSERLVGVEAAHIKWHHAGGPDLEENGLALCSLHHKLFDRGVFTFSSEGLLIVSEYANGGQTFEEWVLKYHNKPIKKPINPLYIPNDNYLHWHYREVFRSPGRMLVI